MNFSTPANSTISSNLRCDLASLHPEDGAVEEDVLAPGQLRVKAGPDLEQAADPPRISARARRSASVIRVRILSSVDLPAPLRPINPSTSPSLDARTRRRASAQISSCCAACSRPRERLRAARRSSRAACRSSPGTRRCGSASRARRPGSHVASSDLVREPRLGAAEEREPADEMSIATATPSAACRVGGGCRRAPSANRRSRASSG